MSVRFTLVPDDYWQFNKFHALHRRVRPVFLYSLLSLFVLVCLAGVWLAVANWRRGGSFDFASLLGPIFIVLYPWVLKAIVLHRAKSSLAYGEECTLTIDEQCVISTARTLESKLAWAAIREIVDAKDYIYIFVTKVNALILPKRAFSTRDEAAAFFTAAMNYKRDAAPGLALSSTNDSGSWPPAPRIGA